MKSRFGKILFVSGVCTMLILNACKKDPKDPPGNDDAVLSEIVKSYTNNTVIKTYTLLSDKSMELLELCEALQASKTQANVQAAAEKWVEARKYWELSEAFLYGPAEYQSLDPRIDSWPLAKAQLDQELAKDLSEVDAAYVRSYYGTNLIGFHAIEYVLFEDGRARDVSKITNRELIYLVAVAGVLMEDCIHLEASWSRNISAAKKQILDDAELSVSYDFGYEMINAGSAGSRFETPQQAVREFVEGCIAIADEVGNEKIASPYHSKNVLEVESWYSWNSLADFTDNIRSIENSYLGGMLGSRGTSLSSYVAGKNPELDTRIKNAIENAIAKINAIPAPFRDQLNNGGSAPAIEAAMEACSNLMDQLSLIDNIIE
jgi:predicted lipoprotein